jgi:predicted acyl esterase
MGTMLAAHGFGYVRVDLAGSGESDGRLHDEYLQSELDDAVEVIAWIADQRWCTGNVGMFGISWSGFNSLQVAAMRPPALKAILSSDSTDDRYADDIHYMGGCVIGFEVAVWSTWCHLFLIAAPDPLIVGDGWLDIWRDRLEHVEPPLGTWLAHQCRDGYWRHGSVCEDPTAIGCPVLMVGGWSDGYRSSVFRMLDALPEQTWALVGPWGHGWPSAVRPGPTVDFDAIIVRWFRHWLGEQAEGIDRDPRLIAFVEDDRRPHERMSDRAGRWVACARWSSESAPVTVFAGSASSAAGAAPFVHWRPDAGAASGIWCPSGGLSDQPGDQAPDDGLAACLDWELAEPLDILGTPRLRLRVEADAERALVAARLCDVAPDGSSTLVADGLLNLTHRDGHERPVPLSPGEPTEIELTLRSAGYRVPAGHRLRLAVSPGSWPMAWPSPTATRLRVYADNAVLMLPTAETAVPATNPWLTSPTGLATEPSRRSFGNRQRTVARNFEDGTITTNFVQEDEETFDDGLVSGHRERSAWTSHPSGPLATTATTTLTMERRRGSWHAAVQSRHSIEADPDAFHVRVDLRANAGSDRVYERTYTWAIPRDGV